MHVPVKRYAVLTSAAVLTAVSLAGGASAADATAGVALTTDAACSGVDLNIFDTAGAVRVGGSPGLAAGSYFVRVTGPDGTTATSPTATLQVGADGRTAGCSTLSELAAAPTTDAAGGYTIQVSADGTFTTNVRTDSFRVSAGAAQATLRVRAFYDADRDGVRDAGEAALSNWKANVSEGGLTWNRPTPVDMVIQPGTYAVHALAPAANWVVTSAASTQSVALAADEDKTVEVGGFCTVPVTGGLTHGFWGNKHGMSLINADDLAALRALALVDGRGRAFDPSTAREVKSFLGASSSTNMANMLSAQLTALTLNLRHGFLNGDAVLFPSLKTISQVAVDANNALLLGSVTTSSSPNRAAQEKVKDLIDDILNNVAPVVSETPCA